ncbi:MAG: FkbM family methyltransferase [Leptolyngbyaceae cyanobacterium]
MVNNCLSQLPCFKDDLVYDLIGFQDLELCLDIGAAAGFTTKKIRNAGTEKTRVIAFEPFEGNHPFFFEATQGLKNIQLIKKAVSVKEGNCLFWVDSLVTGKEKGWQQFEGYSSVGYLLDNNQESTFASLLFKEFREILKRYTKRIFSKPKSPNQGRLYKVESVQLDTIFHEHINFMKVDVQGGEFNVLMSAKKLIESQSIDLIYLEFSGDFRIIDLLKGKFCLFDTNYLIIPNRNKKDLSIWEKYGFYGFENIALSTGVSAYLAKLSHLRGDYVELFRACRKYGYVQTDLICVRQGFLPHFMVNLSEFIKEFHAFE